MCLIAVGVQLRTDVPLVLAANRDEFFARATQAAQFWPDAPELLAGRDLEQGGTWMGLTWGSLTRGGRIAAVTNFRDGGRPRNGQRSRGWLVRDYLLAELDPERYVSNLQSDGEQYDGFNLLVGAGDRIYYCSNRGGAPHLLSPGVHGLSNHLLNTPWPKVEQAKARLAALADTPAELLVERLFELLADDRRAPDDDLPRTGISLEWERVLSSAFIRTADYGTRSSTVILLHANGQAVFEERGFAVDGSLTHQRRYELPAVNA
jgi:uncharacterized protein with NRDE domain